MWVAIKIITIPSLPIFEETSDDKHFDVALPVG